MEHKWEIIIRVAPHSTGNGHDNDQKLVGMEFQTYEIYADGVVNAMSHANAIDLGIHSNPMVWMTEIVKVEQK